MLVLTGPSASGKTDTAKILIAKYNMKKMVTYTTRPLRVGEVNGIDYNFVSIEEFLMMKKNNEFIETTYYNNNYYGSRKNDVSIDKVVILDPNGLNSFYKVLKDNITSFYLDTPNDIRIKRMIERKDSLDIIDKRMANDTKVFQKENYLKIDFMIKNHDIDLEGLADKIYDLYHNINK